MMATYTQWKTEKENLHRLRETVDRICQDLTEGRIKGEPELEGRVERARELCRELFPERLELFDLIYQSRLKRLWEQFGPSDPESGP